MIIVIDGYNILYALYRGPYIDEQQRTEWLRRIAQYAQKKQHDIIVVFDGGSMPWLQKEVYNPCVTLMYSGKHQSADEVIKEYLKKHRSQDIILVTSDKELNIYAHSLGIVGVTSMAFDKYVQGASPITEVKKIVQAEHDACKLSDHNHHDLDQLMHEASTVMLHKPEDMMQPKPKIRAQQRTKKERQRDRQLKKL